MSIADAKVVATKNQMIDGSIIYYPEEYRVVDIVGDKDFLPVAIREFGYRVTRGSCAGAHGNISHEQDFRKQIERLGDIGHIVEIGTWRGLSTAILAHYAHKVTTIDVRYHEEARNLWAYAGVYEKIKYAIIDSEETKQRILSDIEFDCAYIDGKHDYENVKFDFECVKKCGKVLFHDYSEAHPDVIAFVNELPDNELWIDSPFVIWQSTES